MSPLKLILSTVIFISVTHSLNLSAEELDFETQLSVDIVNQYRQLRSSCNDQKGDSRKMCYYRLRIGLWDYKEARKHLALKGIRMTDRSQVAKAH